MELYKQKLYQSDLLTAINSTVDFCKIFNKSVMITGATGLIGSFLVDMFLYSNETLNSKIKIYAIGRNYQRLETRFGINDNLIFIEHDVNDEINFTYKVDYIIHAASNAYPEVFDKDPVGTIMSNVLGTKKLLDYGGKNDCKRFLYISSGEVYGQGDINVDAYKENYSGYIDITNSRSCYPASKRVAETLCCAYSKQNGLETVMVRPCHIFGPNTTNVDNRANVQFVNNILKGENIILKSSGSQIRSYCYIADCCSGLLTVLLNGKKCESYNLSNNNERISIARFAEIIAQLAEKKVLIENYDKTLKDQQSPITRQVLDSTKLEALGWNAKYSIEHGIENTLKILGIKINNMR